MVSDLVFVSVCGGGGSIRQCVRSKIDALLPVKNLAYLVCKLFPVFSVSRHCSFMCTYVHMFVSVTHGTDRHCGVKSGDVFISYKMIWQDVRGAMDYVHIYVSVACGVTSSLPHPPTASL